MQVWALPLAPSIISRRRRSCLCPRGAEPNQQEGWLSGRAGQGLKAGLLLIKQT